mmetsp:Transcript_161085/g.294251  ORF Transcript_161085/g.294251 Transcript_161085/m.294251 type:complete len:483 (-) Transcript_161085:159-1607(-)
MPKVVVATCSMKGHIMPNVKLANYLATLPNFEVHFITDKKEIASPLPAAPVINHLPEADEVPPDGIEAIEDIFAKVALHPKSTNMLWSLYLMVGMYYAVDKKKNPPISPGRVYFVAMQKYIYKTCMELKPDILLAETHYDHCNGMQTFCKKNGIPLLKLLNPGRPDPCFHPEVMQKAFFPDICTGLAVQKEFMAYIPELQVAGGFAQEDWVQSGNAMNILPGCNGLVEVEQNPWEFQVGPFVELPGMMKDVPPPKHEAMDFINSAGDEPVVYIAFGTLVVLNPTLVKALVEGLKDVRCKVLWSIPEVQQQLLPGGLTGPKWCIQKFVPQPAVLRSEKVKCFISHCGNSSTHEAMSTGTPMVCVPYLGDQTDWAKSICEYLKCGITIHKVKGTPAQVKDAVTKILTDPSFAENAKKAQEKVMTESLSPEIPPGEMGVAAVGRVILEVLGGRDYPGERLAIVEAKKKEEEAKNPPKKKSFCTIL